jgi:inner membrane protein
MPSIISHAAVGAAAAMTFGPQEAPVKFWILSVACSVAADADSLAFYLRIPYHHILGHRGFFHSPFFGLLVSLFIVSVFFRHREFFSKEWFFTILYFFLLWTSHGVLDALTSGGQGIAFLAPFDNTRYFFPWTPIAVSPIGVRAFFSRWGLEVMKSELLWIWLPCLAMVLLSRIIRVF